MFGARVKLKLFLSLLIESLVWVLGILEWLRGGMRLFKEVPRGWPSLELSQHGLIFLLMWWTLNLQAWLNWTFCKETKTISKLSLSLMKLKKNSQATFWINCSVTSNKKESIKILAKNGQIWAQIINKQSIWMELLKTFWSWLLKNMAQTTVGTSILILLWTREQSYHNNNSNKDSNSHLQET